MNTQILSINEPQSLATAIDILTSSGLVAFPTDTVYGLGALVFDGNAVGKMYEVKERGIEKAIPILLGDYEQIFLVASGVNHMAEKLARRFWPGPLTLIVPRLPAIPEAVSSLPTVGVRIPDFGPTRELLRLTGPMAVTSASISGQSSPSTARGVQAQLAGRIPLILDGGVTPGGTPSTIVDCTNGKPVIVREGPISLEQIMIALNEI